MRLPGNRTRKMRRQNRTSPPICKSASGDCALEESGLAKSSDCGRIRELYTLRRAGKHEASSLRPSVLERCFLSTRLWVGERSFLVRSSWIRQTASVFGVCQPAHVRGRPLGGNSPGSSSLFRGTTTSTFLAGG